MRAFLKVHPFGRGFPVAAGSALLCYGVLGLALRATVGTTVPALVVCIVVGTTGYAALLWRFRDRVELDLLAGSLRSRRGRRRDGSGGRHGLIYDRSALWSCVASGVGEPSFCRSPKPPPLESTHRVQLTPSLPNTSSIWDW